MTGPIFWRVRPPHPTNDEKLARNPNATPNPLRCAIMTGVWVEIRQARPHGIERYFFTARCPVSYAQQDVLFEVRGKSVYAVSQTIDPPNGYPEYGVGRLRAIDHRRHQATDGCWRCDLEGLHGRAPQSAGSLKELESISGRDESAGGLDPT